MATADIGGRQDLVNLLDPKESPDIDGALDGCGSPVSRMLGLSVSRMARIVSEASDIAQPGGRSITESPASGPTLAVAEIARLAPELLAVARYLVRSDQDARDLAQHTIEIGLRRLGQLREPTKLRAWLIAIEIQEASR